jgi:hypothetical protein
MQPLTYFFKLTQPRKYFYSLVTVHCKQKGGKPDRKPYPPSLCFKKSILKPQVWELSRLCPETSTKLYVHQLGFWTCCLEEYTCVIWMLPNVLCTRIYRSTSAIDIRSVAKTEQLLPLQGARTALASITVQKHAWLRHPAPPPPPG